MFRVQCLKGLRFKGFRVHRVEGLKGLGVYRV